MNVEVILREDFPSLGYVGDKVSVRAGYARNFLLPRGIAVEAFSHNERMMRHQMSGIMSKRAKLKAEAVTLQGRLEGVELSFAVKIGSQGKLFGSITAKDIEAQLKEKGFAIDRKQIKLVEQMKKAGTYKVQVKLHAEVTASLSVKIEHEQAEASKAARAGESVEAEGARKGGRRKKVEAASAEGANAAPTEEKPKKRASKKAAAGEAASESAEEAK